MAKIFENSDQTQETRVEHKPLIFNVMAMKDAAKETLAKSVTHTRTTSASGQSPLVQAIMACVSQAAVLGTTQISMGQVKAMLASGGVDITDKAVAKKVSDYVWNMSERNTKSKSVALLTLIKDASGQFLSGIYGINMSHPSVVAALNEAKAAEEVVAE